MSSDQGSVAGLGGESEAQKYSETGDTQKSEGKGPGDVTAAGQLGAATPLDKEIAQEASRAIPAGRQLAEKTCYTYVLATDERGAGNANHAYEVIGKEEGKPESFLGCVKFQNGPIKEAGLNGLMNEDLLAIVIDRLRGFQSGSFACKENEVALSKVELALSILNERTAARMARGVEGTHQK